MKTSKNLNYFIFALFFAAIPVGLGAQTPFYNLTKGSTLCYVEYDGSGNEMMHYDITTKNVTGSNGNFVVTINNKVTAFVNTEMETSSDIDLVVKVVDGEVIHLEGAVSSAEMDLDLSKQENYVPRIPLNPTVGTELPCGTTKIIIQSSPSRKREARMTVNSFKVIGHENLTTPAGTFDCYIFEMRNENTLLYFKQKGVFKWWYARGIGLVRQEVYSGNGKRLKSSRVLTSIKGR